MKGILKWIKNRGLTFKQRISHKQALNTEKITHTKELSASTKLNINGTDGVLIKHTTVLWQVTKMQTASTFTIWISGNCHAAICLLEHLCGHSPTNESTRWMGDGSLVSFLCSFPAVYKPKICRLTKPWPGTSKSPLPYCNKVVEDKKTLMNMSRTCTTQRLLYLHDSERMLVLWPLCLIILKRTKGVAMNTVNRTGRYRLCKL